MMKEVIKRDGRIVSFDGEETEEPKVINFKAATM